MAKKKKSKSKKKKKKEEKVEKKPLITLDEHVAEAIGALVFLVLAVFFVLAYFDMAGVAGGWIYEMFGMLLGYGYFLLPLSCAVLTISFLKKDTRNLAAVHMAGIVLFFLAGLGIIEVATAGEGGLVGRALGGPMLALFDFYVTFLALGAALIVSVVMICDIRLSELQPIGIRKRKEEDMGEAFTLPREPAAPPAQGEPAAPEPQKQGLFGNSRGAEDAQKDKKEMDLAGGLALDTSRLGTPFTPPPLSLLEKDSGKPSTGDVKANATTIKRTLKNFGIDVEMDEVSIGPSVTRYAVKPAEGVRLSRIEKLSKELQSALAARSIRIEAPIPGRSLVGIEIPNISESRVGLASLLAAGEFAKSSTPLLVALGRSISGNAEFANLSTMPHLLVAGATGAGKSVTVHMLIASLLYRNSPENLKFIMVDPKRVELTLYNSLPHLLTPVITKPKQSILALKWAAKEMERRYDILEEHRVQNIDDYHKTILAPAVKKLEKKKKNITDEDRDNLPETMPYIVIIIDELADIMQMYPKELEAAIVRLAQMSRAVGIHLILSTQRPSVNVITGLIKANIPARIALRVVSQVDSRTIIDIAGAEKLLGKGDMLFQGGGMSKPVRIQSGFVSGDELKNVTDWLKKHYSDSLSSEIDFESSSQENNSADLFSSVSLDEGADEEDDKFEEAKAVVIADGRASTSYLQRKLGIGYSRAAKIIDMLEAKGVIGPQNGSKPREVFVRSEEEGSAGEEGASAPEPAANYDENQSRLNNEV